MVENDGFVETERSSFTNRKSSSSNPTLQRLEMSQNSFSIWESENIFDLFFFVFPPALMHFKLEMKSSNLIKNEKLRLREFQLRQWNDFIAKITVW